MLSGRPREPGKIIRMDIQLAIIRVLSVMLGLAGTPAHAVAPLVPAALFIAMVTRSM